MWRQDEQRVSACGERREVRRRGIDIGGGGRGQPRAEQCIESSKAGQGKATAQTSRAAQEKQTAAVFGSAAEGESQQQRNVEGQMLNPNVTEQRKASEQAEQLNLASLAEVRLHKSENENNWKIAKI